MLIFVFIFSTYVVMGNQDFGAISPIPEDVEIHYKKYKLGEKIFHDPGLSSSGKISCASCHKMDKFGTDNKRVSDGVKGRKGSRNSLSVFNLIFTNPYFWDGRAANLEEQIDGPIHHPSEMNSNWSHILKIIKSRPSYQEKFREVYPNQGVSIQTIKNAIVEFEKGLITPGSLFDQYLKGNKNALNKIQKEGYELFKSFGCISCHQGTNIGGNMMQKFGVTKELPPTNLGKDKGRQEVTKNTLDAHIFRVPSLRNVAKTSPYFHDGSVKKLSEAIRLMGRYQVGEEISDKDIHAIEEFLKTLTGYLKKVTP